MEAAKSRLEGSIPREVTFFGTSDPTSELLDKLVVSTIVPEDSYSEFSDVGSFENFYIIHHLLEHFIFRFERITSEK